jgi:peptidoglycan/xylan/chitin deacetylase (PgdA/CDA1 family)
MTLHRAALLSLLIALAAVAILVPQPWLIGGLIIAAYLVLQGLGAAWPRLQFFGPIVCRGPVGKRQVALTFDDGPDPAVTPLLLDTLRQLQVQATFFCCGDHVLRHPDLARRIVAEGHLIANHSHRHQWWHNFRFRSMTPEIRAAQEAIASVTGTPPRYYRPPCGLTNPRVPVAARALGLTLVGWTARGFDQFTAAPEAIVRRLIGRTGDGSIILLHDSGLPPERLLAVVTEVVATVRRSGLQFARLDHLLDRSAAGP